MNGPIKLIAFFAAAAVSFAACSTAPFNSSFSGPSSTEFRGRRANLSSEVRKLLESADDQVQVTRGYTQQYFSIEYPGGDLPPETGACTDVVVRAFRNAGVDLQKEVHDDMAAHFAAYPQKWGLGKTDTNIDHRRVPNLQTFFARRGKSLPITNEPADYQPGDVVSWDLDGRGTTHIGLVSDRRNESTKRYLIIHNIGGGTNAEDRLFEWRITGHFRYF